MISGFVDGFGAAVDPDPEAELVAGSVAPCTLPKSRSAMLIGKVLGGGEIVRRR